MLLPVTSRSTWDARSPLSPILKAMFVPHSVDLLYFRQGNGAHAGEIQGDTTALAQGYAVHIGAHQGHQLLHPVGIAAVGTDVVASRRQRIAVAILSVPGKRMLA